jgi:pimeloyl-ACP methyl ester carboxylesterase
MMMENSNLSYYEVYGEGCPIIFIHPPAMGHVVFKYQKKLANKYRVILYDIRGHGKSTYEVRDMSISALADDVIQILNELKIEKAVICGYSSGGSIAQEVAITYPSRVKALILCGGFSEVSTFLLRNEFKIGINFAKEHLELLSTILAKSHRVTSDDEIEIKRYVMLTNKNALVELYKYGLHYNCTDKLSSITVPTCLIYGKNDFYIQPYQTKYKDRIKSLKVIYIDDVFHQVPTKKYSAFNHAIDTFLRSENLSRS